MVRELATGRPRNVPCNIRCGIAPFTTFVQGRYTGKTRFLLEQIIEDQDERSLVIYLTMKSKRGEGIVTSKCMDILLSVMKNYDLENSMYYFLYFYSWFKTNK